MWNEFLKKLLIPAIATLALSTTFWSCVITWLDEAPIVSVDNAVAVGSSTFRPLQIVNPRSSKLDGLVLVVPRKIDPSRIITSAPLSMTAFDGELSLSEWRRLKVSGIAAYQAVTILVPSEQGAGSPDVSVLAEGETYVRVFQKGAVTGGGRLLNTVFLGLIAALIGMTPWLLGAVLLKSQFDRNSEEAARLEKFVATTGESAEKLGKDSEELGKQIKTQIAALEKDRVFLLARLGQYARELEFWRDAIRKILYQQGSEKKHVQMFLQKISESLRTYSTHERVSTDAVLRIFEQHLQATRPEAPSTPRPGDSSK